MAGSLEVTAFTSAGKWSGTLKVLDALRTFCMLYFSIYLHQNYVIFTCIKYCLFFGFQLLLLVVNTQTHKIVTLVKHIVYHIIK